MIDSSREEDKEHEQEPARYEEEGDEAEGRTCWSVLACANLELSKGLAHELP